MASMLGLCVMSRAQQASASCLYESGVEAGTTGLRPWKMLRASEGPGCMLLYGLLPVYSSYLHQEPQKITRASRSANEREKLRHVGGSMLL
jgi:hypothetical protein